MQNKLGKNFKICATCALWAGNRTIELGRYAKFETSEKGKCLGGGYKGASVNAMAHCNVWEVWPPIRG